MKTSINRQTVDLSLHSHPGVTYLRMPVRTWAGIKTLSGIGPRLEEVDVAARGSMFSSWDWAQQWGETPEEYRESELCPGADPRLLPPSSVSSAWEQENQR